MPAPQMQTGAVTSTIINALAQYIDDTRTGILAIGIRTTNSSTTTTEIGVLRLDDVPIKAGHRIEIKTNSISMHSTVLSDCIQSNLRYTTDGSTPTTSSTVLNDVQLTVNNTGLPSKGIVSSTYVPANDESLSVLLTIRRRTGTGNAQILSGSDFPTELTVVDLGVDTGDVGVDI